MFDYTIVWYKCEISVALRVIIQPSSNGLVYYVRLKRNE